MARKTGNIAIDDVPTITPITPRPSTNEIQYDVRKQSAPNQRKASRLSQFSQVVIEKLTWRNILTLSVQGSGLLALLYFFICSLDLLSRSFQLLGGQAAGEVFGNSELLKNPIAGLVVGVLATVLLQSSSTTTSILVSLVSTKVVPVDVAIPIVMGSNIGTSVTSTLVSLGHSGDRREFERAFAGATVHDMFNWMSVLVLLPIEAGTHYLRHVTALMMNKAGNDTDAEEPPKLLGVITEPLTNLFVQLNENAIRDAATGKSNDTFDIVKKNCSDNAQVENTCIHMFAHSSLSNSAVGGIVLVIALVGLIACLTAIVKLLNAMLQGPLSHTMHRYINSNLPHPFGFLTGYVAMLAGVLVTILVQSSSVVTSTLTPLVGVGVLKLERMFPVALGANVGTTFTAILAALASPDVETALQIALCHLMFNLSGIVIYYVIPFMRQIPLSMARTLGRTTARYRWFAVMYLLMAFIILPGIVFGLSVAGLAAVLSVLVPCLLIVLVTVLINIIQSRWPNKLPVWLRTWEFLPKCLHSLEPLDWVITATFRHVNCRRCFKRKDTVEPRSISVVAQRYN